MLWACQVVAKVDIGVKVVIIIIFVIQMKHILHVRQIAAGQLIHHIHHLALVVVHQDIILMANRVGSA